MFESVAATPAERAETRRGDDLVAPADVTMDRAFTVPGEPGAVWPWLLQLGKWRAGWYLSHRIERFIPHGRRAIRVIDPRWQTLRVGDDIPDYGGRHEVFTVAEIDPPHSLVYRSHRGRAAVSWSITLRPEPRDEARLGTQRTRVLLRLRMGRVTHVRLAKTAGELLDLLTVAGMAAGLRERLAAGPSGPLGAADR